MADTYVGSRVVTPDVSQQTVDAVRMALSSGRAVPGDPGVLAKATTQGWSIATGTVGLLLEAPAANLFPVLSPIRNWMSRHGAPNGATAVQWRAITAINASGLKAGVPDGLRNQVVTTSERDRQQAFKSFGLDDFVTYDAQDTAQGFMDLRAEATANLLAAVMVEEEKLILGGNVTKIGAPASLSFADTEPDTAGSLTPSNTYYYGVSALTLYGFLNAASGRNTVTSADSLDETDTVTGSHQCTASGAGSTATLISWPAVRGAVAYNIFACKTNSTKRFVATVTVPRFVMSEDPPLTGNTVNSSDETADALSFDGLIPQIQANAGSQYHDPTSLYNGGGYFIDLKGAPLSADSANGVNEMDAMLKNLWDTARIGPTRIYVNSQEAESLGKLITTGGSGIGTVRWNQTLNPDGGVTGGLVADSYRNKYTAPRIIPIEIHPYLAPGSILALSERLPFPRTNVPTPFQLEVLREYTSYDWANVQRKWEFGVYGRECLKVYFPAGCGAMVGIAPS